MFLLFFFFLIARPELFFKDKNNFFSFLSPPFPPISCNNFSGRNNTKLLYLCLALSLSTTTQYPLSFPIFPLPIPLKFRFWVSRWVSAFEIRKLDYPSRFCNFEFYNNSNETCFWIFVFLDVAKGIKITLGL